MNLRLQESDGRVVIPVVAKPSAKKDGIVGLYGSSLKVAVTAAPEKGKANKAIVKVLAKRLGVPASSVTIVSGEMSRNKKVSVQGLRASDLVGRLGLGGIV